MDEEINTFRRQVTFHFLDYLLSHNMEFVNDTCRTYINDARSIFDGIARGLESVLNPEKEYYHAEDLREMVGKIDPQYPDIGKCTKEQINEMVKRVKRIIEDLDVLNRNPKIFYQKRIRKEKLWSIFRRMEDFYDWKEITSRPPVLGEAKTGVLLD